MAPNLRAEWPLVSVPNILTQELTIWDFEGNEPVLFGKTGPEGLPAAWQSAKARSFTARAQAHPVQQGFSPQQRKVLATPKACWSIFECGRNSLTHFLSSMIVMCFHSTFESSTSRSIQATPHAYAKPAKGTHKDAQGLCHFASTLSTGISGALLTGPLFLVRDLLQSTKVRLSQASRSKPASTWASLSSCR